MQAHTQESADPQAGTVSAHPAADIFPLMVGADFDALVADISEHGQREPIVMHDGLVLDGRNRLRACRELGIEPSITTWNGKGTAEEFVLSMNLHRRHLSQTERAMVAAKLATRAVGRPSQENSSIELISQESAAKLLNVSVASVKRAATVIKKGAPELLQAVENGTIAASKAAKLTKLSKARQQEIATSPAKAKKAAKRLDREKAATLQQVHTEDLARSEPPVQSDPEFQAEAEASARDIEFERAERIAFAGADHLVIENEKLTKQVQFLDRRIAGLLEELGSAKYCERMWKERALAAGWQAQTDA